VLPDCNEWPGTRTPNVHEVVAAITSVTAKNGKVCEIPEGSGPDHIEHVPEPSPAEEYAARSHIFRWAGARCARSRGTWGSEKSLWRDYVGWRQQHKLSSLPRELFCENLNRCFDREKNGWRGIALAVDVEAAKVFLLRRSKPCEFCNKICLLLPECLKAPLSRSDLNTYVHGGIPYLIVDRHAANNRESTSFASSSALRVFLRSNSSATACTQHVAFSVGHDGHASPADLQPEHERGYGVASFVIGRAFVPASPLIHCTSLRHLEIIGGL
jgi:hypothetical protein